MSISCLPDVARAIKALKSAGTYLSADPSQPKSILPRLPNGPARNTARSCCRIITGLTRHVLASAPHLESPCPTGPLHGNEETVQEQMGNLRNSDSWNFTDQRLSDQSGSETADLYQTFLNLFPDVPTLPNLEGSQTSFNNQGSFPTQEGLGGGSDTGIMSQFSWETAPLSAWSIGDLLRAGSAPQ